MRAPIIGVSGSVSADEKQQYILRAYFRAVLHAGGLPLLLPMDMDGAATARCLDRMDGLLLAGGSDIAPALFGEQPCSALGAVNPLRDRFEPPLIRMAYERDIPTLGICRGIQAMAVALGGALYQDLPSQCAGGGKLLVHAQAEPYDVPCHEAEIADGSLLYGCVRAARLRVNSMHHQAVKPPLPECLKVCASAPDGVIEGVEAPDRAFFLGVQWHPERMFNCDEASAALFGAHVAACIEYMGGKDR